MGVWVDQGIGLFRVKARNVHPGSPIIPVYCCLRLTYHPGPHTLMGMGLRHAPDHHAKPTYKRLT